MNYITLDLEWNQAYPEQSLAVQKRLCARLRGEVIQIGAVKLDEKLRPCGSYSVIVRPRYFRRIHKHVRNLTGITQDMIDHGIPLEEAAERFRRFCGEEFAFLTWGPDDIPMLKDNLRVHHMDTSWLDRVYDLQPIFNRQTDGKKTQRSLEYAMDLYGIPQNLPAHDALNDAYFTALVASKLDIEKGIAQYEVRDEGDALLSATYGDADVGDTGYETLEALLEEPKLKTPVCPLCKATLSEKEPRLHAKGQRYSQLFTCSEHGDIFFTYRVQRNYDETWRAHLTVHTPTEEELDRYRKKLKEANEFRRAKSKTSRPRRRRRPTNKSAEAAVASVSE